MKILKTLSVLCAALAFAACSKDETDNSNPSGNGSSLSGEPCEVNVLISSKLTRGITDNFVDGTDDENAIKTLEFYVFDSSGAPDTEVGKTESTAGEGYIKFTTTTNEYSKKIIMSGGDDKKIVAVINMNINAPVASYNDLKAKLASGEFKATAGDTDHNARVEARAEGFEMTGETVVDIVASKINNVVTVNVARLASRINAPKFSAGSGNPVEITIGDSGRSNLWDESLNITNDKLSFDFEGYAVINGLSKSDAFFIGNPEGNDRKLKTVNVGGVDIFVPDWSTWSKTGKTYLASSFDSSTKDYTNVYSGKNIAGDSWFLDANVTGEHRVYVYENKPTTVTVSGQTGYSPASTYALVVKGTLVVDNDVTNANGLNKTRYWRINLTRDDDYHMLRNCSYDITVKKLSSAGYPTPEEAEKGEEIIPGKTETAGDVEVKVSQWRVNTYETEM